MANFTHNRIDAILPPADMADISAAIQLIHSKLPFLQALTPEERESLLKMSVNNRVFVEKVLQEMQHTQNLFPPYLSVTQIQHDKNLFDQLDNLVSQVKNLLNLLEDSRRIAAHESYSMSLGVYQFYKNASQNGIPNAIAPYQRLKTRFESKKKSKPEEEE
jgi:hypothetical protein